MLKVINHNGTEYPALQAEGFASQYAFPFANKLLLGIGCDVGCKLPQWAFPGARPVDPTIDPEYHAMNLPPGHFDYIASSHMLEHYEGRFQDVIEYWLTCLKPRGIIFLYLPNCDYQKYWAWGNKKHVHYLNPSIMREYCETLTVNRFIVTDGYDLNGSFYCIIEK